MPHYLSTTIPRKAMRDMARLRLFCHALKSEVGRYSDVARHVNVIRFVHECMAVFDAMQPEQPHQAGLVSCNTPG